MKLMVLIIFSVTVTLSLSLHGDRRDTVTAGHPLCTVFNVHSQTPGASWLCQYVGSGDITCSVTSDQ